MTMHGRCGRGVENRLDVFVVRPGCVIAVRDSGGISRDLMIGGSARAP